MAEWFRGADKHFRVFPHCAKTVLLCLTDQSFYSSKIHVCWLLARSMITCSMSRMSSCWNLCQDLCVVFLAWECVSNVLSLSCMLKKSISQILLSLLGVKCPCTTSWCHRNLQYLCWLVVQVFWDLNWWTVLCWNSLEWRHPYPHSVHPSLLTSLLFWFTEVTVMAIETVTDSCFHPPLNNTWVWSI